MRNLLPLPHSALQLHYSALQTTNCDPHPSTELETSLEACTLQFSGLSSVLAPMLSHMLTSRSPAASLRRSGIARPASLTWLSSSWSLPQSTSAVSACSVRSCMETFWAWSNFHCWTSWIWLSTPGVPVNRFRPSRTLSTMADPVVTSPSTMHRQLHELLAHLLRVPFELHWPQTTLQLLMEHQQPAQLHFTETLVALNQLVDFELVGLNEDGSARNFDDLQHKLLPRAARAREHGCQAALWELVATIARKVLHVLMLCVDRWHAEQVADALEAFLSTVEGCTDTAQVL